MANFCTAQNLRLTLWQSPDFSLLLSPPWFPADGAVGAGQKVGARIGNARGKGCQTGEGSRLQVFVKVLRVRVWALSRGFACLKLVLLLSFGAALAPISEATAASAVKAAIIVDMNSGKVLYAQSADVSRAPASLTKIMTLYILFAYLRAGKLTYDTDLKVSAHAASQAPTKLGLKPGSTIKTIDAIRALVTKSANDAAATIAENLGGSEENFARMMTQTARNLGMKNTTFRNASGLPNDEQLTTARDMAILATHVINDYPEYYGHFETRYFAYQGRKYRNHNRLLFGYKGTDGIKTGYTRASGFNLTCLLYTSPSPRD